MKEFSVFIERLKLYLKCGVYEEEKSLGVQVELDVKVTSSEFVDYQQLYLTVLEISKNTFTYIEEFEEKLLEKIIDKWNPESVIIRVVKLSIPFQHSFERAGVELRWKREK